MNKFIILALLVVGIAAQSQSITPCSCAQLLSQGDCTQSSLGCAWNATTSVCATSTATVTPTVTYAQYCDNFSETDCPKTSGCAWVSSKCTFFTGCTPFAKTTDADCQAISNKCITDGTHCVEVTICSSFVKQLPCVKNSSGAYCYWDTKTNAALPVCVDANTCDKLPATLTTDKLCRDQISTCTTTGTGCVTSGTNCSDQTAQISCVWNLAKSQACYWTGSACVDLKCENAPTTLTTDDACKAFTTSGTCTTKSGGGCITRTTCSAATIQAACVTNSSGSACYWNTTACVDKTCANAPSTLTTNSACSGFLTTCITTGTGCVTNSTCSSATTQAACVQNAAGTTCIWDTTCKEKTCANAPAANNSHALCTTYLSTCTVNASSNGCTNRTCANGPTSLVSNTDCESYLPKSNCITKTSGGCVVNTTCAAITVQGACVADVNGTVCFWDPTGAGSCKDKTCVNAPSSYTDDATCSSFLKTCTVASGGSGCVNRTCENLLTAALCTTDLNNKPCAFKGLCYMKQCALASSAFTTHSDCNGYLSSCTLSNTGSGCVPIPLVCSAITNSAACQSKKIVNALTGAITYGTCGWNGTQCIDWGCTTVATTNTTTSQCGTALTNCVSANPVNGTVAGCIDLPTTCGARKTQDNCLVTRVSFPTCEWNTVTNACTDKTCLTASVTGTVSLLGSFTAATCAGYLSSVTCLLSNTSDSCIAPSASCTSLTIAANCIAGSKTNNGNCFWNATQSKCLEVACANLDKTSHVDCYGAMSNHLCTVNATNNGCISLAACTSYTTQNQCVVNTAGKVCVWDVITAKCLNSSCASAASSASYQTDTTCAAYSAVSDSSCTVIYKVQNKGCVAKATSCTDYVDQLQCEFNAAGGDCIWHNNLCWTYSTFACTNIKGITFATPACENVAYYCKVNGDASGCMQKVCGDYLQTTGLTAGGTAIATTAECVALDPTCVLNNQATKTCQTKLATCGGYLTTLTCTDSTAGACVWVPAATPICVLATSPCSSFVGADAAACEVFNAFCTAGTPTAATTPCVNKACSAKTGAAGAITQAICQTFNSTCAVNNDGSACVTADTCENYGVTQTSCVYNTSGKKCFWNAAASPAATCQSITSANCGLITGAAASQTREICQSYSTACTATRDGAACVAIAAACTTYGTTLNSCVESTATKCIQSQSADAGASCVAVAATTACTALYVKSGTTYTDAICKALLSTCTNNSTTGCTAKTCANATPSASYANCQTWLSSCTYNGTGCVAISATCAAQTSTTCWPATEGECVPSGTACIKKTCDTAAITVITHADCQTYLSSCTVARTGGCQARAACSSYKSAIQCYTSSTGGKCTWNTVTLTCADLTCANLEQSSTYNSHNACYGVTGASPRCTIKALNGSQVNGCMSLGSCSSYTIQAQCVINSSSPAGNCEWNTNLATPACADKTCATASTGSYSTHSGCQGYLTSCTAAVVVTNGVSSLAGCQSLAACATYTMQEQCVVDGSSNACGWNGTTCANKTCLTAPATADYSSDAQCRAYLAGCTVAASGQGCIAIAACESYTTVGQCVSNTTGALCYWNATTSACITRTCENAPSDTADASACNTYLAGCTLDTVKCKTKICEDFTLATDALCSAALSTCTSNGTNCVLRGTCAQATSSFACVTQSNGSQCQWIAANGSVAAYCTVKTCATATADIVTESGCQAYFTGCTTKSGGGCVVKSTCAAANVQAACTKDSTGTITCQWDSTANACRNKACGDYSGSSHTVCQGISTSCTAGANGFCAPIASCTNTKVRAACVQGTDGPCLWIAGYSNTDGTKGACFPYTSCKSLNWASNTSCNLISEKCTTNGTNCVGITLCTETNTSGGCVNGYDGACIQSVDSLGSANAATCRAYTSCADAFYATHAACQTASSKCTTNGTTGCIALGACSTYAQAGCYFNNVGVVSSSGAITSTGICTWDLTAGACRDQNCSDLTGSNNAACSSQLSSCTSDGTKCIAKAACSSYAQAGCSSGIGVGTDGICFWDSTATTPACRPMACGDVVSGTSTAVCSAGLSGCISDGAKCIAKATCSTYTTKTSCNSGGSDGICVFTASTATGAVAGTGTCKAITACADAASDQTACTAVKDRCAWTAATTGTNATASKCTTHTCATHQSTAGVCGNFLNWGKTLQQVCTIQNATCSATDASTLTSANCYSVSGYTYTWSSSSSKCGVCTTPVVTPNTTNNTNTTNSTGNTTTTHGYILGFASVILAYLVL